ncbi:serine hydrolase domain-containing protein [Conexibacter woesei]|uniref:serine hydrolase domain-containing protein n=1 Tax=Conexibacter woesei TaxID=191495 RepID=UPI0005A2A2CB
MRPRRRRATALATALALVTGLVAMTPLSAQAAHESTQAALSAWQPHSGGPGAAVMGGDATTRWTLQSGVRNIYERTGIGPDDHFRIGSETKTYTASVVLQLVDERLVDLDGTVEQYLPGVLTSPYDGRVITVRQLLQHRSGIPNYTDNNPRMQLDGTYLMADLVRAALSQAPWFAPGTSIRYSNTNYILLGMLIERVTGQSIRTEITDRIIRPLGLTETRYPAPGDKSIGPPAVHGYVGTRIGPLTGWIDISNIFEPSLAGPAGAIISTLDDTVTFYRALFSGQVVSAASLTQMRTAFPGIKDGYGLGIYKANLSCGTAWGHNGASPGYFTETLVGDNGRHASIVTNTVSTDASEPSGRTVLEKAICDG